MPPHYTRGYSFTTHSTTQPNVPQPGDKLDQEFDDIATAVNAGAGAVDAITNPDGSLADAIVGLNNFKPGIFDTIAAGIEADVQPKVDDAAASAAAAAASASQAQDYALESQDAAATAASFATATAGEANTALAASATSQSAAVDAKMFSDRAGNSATTAEGAMSNALDHSELAFKWAEYLAGPVEPAPPGWPEAIDDGLWSSKWWAIRAREIVGSWGGLYLGAYPQPPFMDPDNPWPPGALYFDTTLGTMFVWNGGAWVSFTNLPAPSVAISFVYAATEGQTVFSGVDLQGLTPALDPLKAQPSDVHVNGVRLVLDNFGGGDFTVDRATSTLTINQGLPAGSIVQWDLWLSPSQLAPGSVIVHKLLDIDRDPVTNDPGEFDGVRTTFPLRYVDPASGTIVPCTPGDGVQLQVSIDGVQQEFGVDFSSAGSDIVFADAPPIGTRFWAVWYQPGTPAP
jgi:hypothetical protein